MAKLLKTHFKFRKSLDLNFHYVFQGSKFISKFLLVLLLISHGKCKFIIVSLLFTACTFGSVGNKLQEDAIILENFLRLVRDIPGNFQPLVFSYDDQFDSDLTRFNITSGRGATTRNYQVRILEENSFLDLDRLEFRFNPPDRPFGSLSIRSQSSEVNSISKTFATSPSQTLSLTTVNDEIPGNNTTIEIQSDQMSRSLAPHSLEQKALAVSRTHTPFTIPLDLPPDNPYGKIYTSRGSRIGTFMNSNSPGIGRGNVASNSFSPIPNAPQGNLASTNVFIRRWDINVFIQEIDSLGNPVIPPNTRNLRISIRDNHQELLPRCKTEVQRSTNTEWILGLNYFRLFRDLPTQVEVLNQIFNQTASNPTSLIHVTDLSSFYNFFLTNLQSYDAVVIQESCLL